MLQVLRCTLLGLIAGSSLFLPAHSAGVAESPTFPQPFTLSAVNVTLPNANSTGAPLVVGQNGTWPNNSLLYFGGFELRWLVQKPARPINPLPNNITLT